MLGGHQMQSDGRTRGCLVMEGYGVANWVIRLCKGTMDGVHVVCLLVSILECMVRVGGRWWSMVVDDEDTEVTVIAAFTHVFLVNP